MIRGTQKYTIVKPVYSVEYTYNNIFKRLQYCILYSVRVELCVQAWQTGPQGGGVWFES
jgi:hypothetical protein